MKLLNLGYCAVFGFAVTACGGGGGSGSDNSQPQQFTVTAEAGPGGSITPASQSVQSGDATSFTLATDPGFTIGSVSGCNGTLANTEYQTGSITADCTVKATFVELSSSGAVTAEILFPWKVFRTDASTVTVRGIATGGSNIKAVRVNGVDASFTSAQSNSQSFSTLSSATTSNAGTDEITWTATVSIPSNSNATLTVETEDVEGNIDPSADSAELITQKVPEIFSIDSDGDRLIGQVNRSQFAVYGLTDGQYELLDTEDMDLCHAQAYRADANQVICAHLYNGELSLTGLSMSSAELNSLVTHNLNLDPEEWSFAHVQELLVSPSNEFLFILLKVFHAEVYEKNKSQILRYDFASNHIETLVDATESNGNTVATDNFAYSDKGLLVFNGFWGDDFSNDGLSLVRFSDTVSTFAAAPSNLLLSSVDVNSDYDTAYMAGYEGIAKADLANGLTVVLSQESEEELFNISQIRSTGLDEKNNRLLVADSDFDYILAVDLESGQRSEFAANGIGEGKRLLATRALALNEDHGVAYLLDDGGNSREVLIEAELDTGNRKVLTNFEFDCNHNASDIVFDSDNGKIYAIFQNAIFDIDAITGSSRKLADSSEDDWDCSAPKRAFTGAALDKENNRLLVTDAINDALLEVDLSTGAVGTLLASSELFGNAVDVALSSKATEAFVLSQASGNVYSYDLASGETALLLDSCQGSWGNMLIEDSGNVQSLYFDSASNALWITAESILKYNLDTNTCEIMGDERPFNSVFDLTLSERGQLLGTRFNQMIQIDFESGEHVVISK